METVRALPAKPLSAGGEDPRSLFWPDHTQLPDENGAFVKNVQEHPQSILLTTSIEPMLRQRHPQGDYCIGQDSGIYWDLAAVQTDTPIKGAEAPNWFYVPGVPPLLDGKFRRSYVLWHEHIAPLVVVEFVSGDGGTKSATRLRTGGNSGFTSREYEFPSMLFLSTIRPMLSYTIW